MASEFSFSVMPSVSISRSRFNRKSQHKTSFNLGEIIPIYVDEVLPGDTRTFDMATLVRMSTPIAPIMDNIYLDVYAFFVPNRIVWDHWKEFMGENNTSAGIPVTTVSVPQIYVYSHPTGSLCDYFGLPQPSGSGYFTVSALPFRAYYKIYNRWFRNENIVAPIAVETGDTAGALVGVATNSGVNVLKAAKLADYFTKALPYAQKGSAVSVPIGTSAPIYVQLGSGAVANNTYNMQVSPTASQISAGQIGLNVGAGNLKLDNTGSGSDTSGGMFADLSQATAATINQLRYAFQLQKLLEKDALYGTRLKFPCLVKIAEKIWKAMSSWLIRSEGLMASCNA